jgi:hypothetical protein
VKDLNVLALLQLAVTRKWRRVLLPLRGSFQ